MSYNSDSFLRPIGSNKNIKIFNSIGDLSYTIKPTFITSIISNGNILNITLKSKLISLDFVSYDEATSAEVKLTQQVSLLLENNEYSDTSIVSFINEVDAAYSYDKFLRPLTDTDRNIKILDNNGIVNFTIDPFSIININATNNLIKINVKSSKVIILDFSSTNEAKIALERLREQIDILTEKVPLLIDKDIQIFITDLINNNPGPTGYSGTSGSSGTSGTSGIGLTGSNGTSGTSGTSGIGLTGSNGTSGTSGTSGIGLTGPAGIGVTSSFFIKGTTQSAYDTTSIIYRTGAILIGTASVDINDRFIVSSNGGTVSFVIDNDGSVYNRRKGITNTVYGYQSLLLNINGGNNTAIGYASLQSNTTGSSNSAVGFQSLQSNTIGGNNTAIGYGSLKLNTSGSANVGIGYESLNKNTTGFYNTAVGQHTLYNNTGGHNTAIGFASLFANITGFNNSALGDTSLFSNTTGSENTAVGYAALYSNTTGAHNTGIGNLSLYSNTTGSENTALGYYSQFYNTSGSNNTTLGYYSLYSNSTGGQNTALGYQSLVNINTGSYNTAIGIYSGYAHNSYNSIFIGYNTNAQTSEQDNQIVIGNNTVGNGSNSVVIGNDSITNTILKGNLGLGTTIPLSKVHIIGQITIQDGTEGAGRVLTSDVNGLATWEISGGATGPTGPGFYGTSSTEFKMPIYGNVVEIQTQPYLGYSTDQWVIVSSSSEYAVSPYYDEFTDPLFYAIVDDYNNETGILNLVCQYSTLAGTTFNQWFINLTGAFKNLSSLGPLPVPKVKLQKGKQNIEYLRIDENLGNTVTGGTFELVNYPVVITQDLTDIQINLGANRLLFVEMVHYRRKTNKRGSTSNSAGYVTAGTCYNIWPSYLPWPENFWTRNNSAKNYPGGFVGDTIKDRQNYFPITYHNERINVFNMLHNRFHEYDISYNDTNVGVTFLNTIIPSIGYTKAYKNQPTNMFSYSPYYTPYYIAFRYIIYNTEDNKIISGPLSEIVKITHQYHPFRTNYINSFNSSPSAEINNLYNKNTMQCWMVRKR